MGPSFRKIMTNDDIMHGSPEGKLTSLYRTTKYRSSVEKKLSTSSTKILKSSKICRNNVSYPPRLSTQVGTEKNLILETESGHICEWQDKYDDLQKMTSFLGVHGSWALFMTKQWPWGGWVIKFRNFDDVINGRSLSTLKDSCCSLHTRNNPMKRERH